MPEIEYPESLKKPSLGRRAVRGSGRLGSWIFRTLMKLVLIVLFIAVGLFVGGFLQFTNQVTDSVQPADGEPAQAIVALTGGSTRMATALELLQQKVRYVCQELCGMQSFRSHACTVNIYKARDELTLKKKIRFLVRCM